MTDPQKSSWLEYKQLLLEGQKQARENIRDLYKTCDNHSVHFNAQIAELKTELAVLKVKVAMGAFILSSVVSVVVGVATNYFSQ